MNKYKTSHKQVINSYKVGVIRLGPRLASYGIGIAYLIGTIWIAEWAAVTLNWVQTGTDWGLTMDLESGNVLSEPYNESPGSDPPPCA